MKTKKTAIFICATPEKVWEILTNLDEWKSWNPTVREVEGEAKLGNKLKVTLKAGGKSGTVMKPVISQFEQQKSMVWTTSLGAGVIFKNEKVIELEKSEKGTMVIHKELFGGLLPTLTWGTFKNSVQPMLDATNHGLKRKAENTLK